MLPVLASRWHSAVNRKQAAMRAAHEQDIDALCELLEVYMRLKSKRKGQISARTILYYQESVHRLIHYLKPDDVPNVSLFQLTAEDLELWLFQMHQEGFKPNTLQRHLYGIRSFFKALIWAEVLKDDPSRSVTTPADPTPAHTRKGALSLDIYRQLLALAQQKESPRRERDSLLLLLGGSLGLRVSEIVGLNVDDIDIAYGHMKVRGKGGKVRTLPLTTQFREAVTRWLEQRYSLSLLHPIDEVALLLSFKPENHGGRLSTNGARLIINPYYRALGLPLELNGMHTLRRTAGTHLYRATRDLHVVSDVLGHASVNTSAIYAKMDSDVRLEALENLSKLQKEPDKS